MDLDLEMKRSMADAARALEARDVEAIERWAAGYRQQLHKSLAHHPDAIRSEFMSLLDELVGHLIGSLRADDDGDDAKQTHHLDGIKDFARRYAMAMEAAFGRSESLMSAAASESYARVLKRKMHQSRGNS
jgi:hypothetical protein